MTKSLFFVISLVISLSFITCRSRDSRSYDKLLIALTEVNQAVGLEDNKVYELITQMSNSMSETYDNFRVLAQRYLTQCQAGDSLMNALISKIKFDISSSSTFIYQSEKEIADSQKELSNYKSDIEKAKKEYKELQVKISNQIKDYSLYASEADQKLVTIQVLQNLINDELLSKQINKPSFVQLKDSPLKIQSLRKSIENRLKDYNPIENTMVLTLLSMAQSTGFSNKQLLYKILNVLQKMEQNLIDFRSRQEITHKDLIDNMKKLQHEKSENIRTVEDIIAKKNSHVIELEYAISYAKKDQIVNQKTLERKTGEIRFWTDLCNQQKKFESTFNSWKNDIEQSLMKASENLNLHK